MAPVVQADPLDHWAASFGWWHALSDTVIGVACCCIAAALLALRIKRPEVGRARLIVWFAVCVLACGVSHLLAHAPLLVPAGLAEAVGHLCLALLSTGAAVAVWPLVLRVADAPSPARLLAINEELSRLQASTAQSNRWLVMAEQLAQIGHWRVSLPDQRVSWSDEVFRIHGLPTGDAPALNAAFAAYHPDDQDGVAAAFRTDDGDCGQLRIRSEAVSPGRRDPSRAIEGRGSARNRRRACLGVRRVRGHHGGETSGGGEGGGRREVGGGAAYGGAGDGWPAVSRTTSTTCCRRSPRRRS